MSSPLIARYGIGSARIPSLVEAGFLAGPRHTPRCVAWIRLPTSVGSARDVVLPGDLPPDLDDRRGDGGWGCGRRPLGARLRPRPRPGSPHLVPAHRLPSAPPRRRRQSIYGFGTAG